MRAGDVSLWEAVLPAEVLRLPEELARVDALLDDLVFFVPFVPFFDPRVGRGIDADGNLPADDVSEVPLRTWGTRACVGRSATRSPGGGSPRIPIDGHVPHPTTLMKLTTRCGIEAVQGCNEALLARAAGKAVAHHRRCAPTPRWSRPTWPIRPIRGCWPRRCDRSRRAVAGSRPLVAGSAPVCGTAAARLGNGRMGSPRSSGSVRRRARRQATVRRITGELAWLAQRAAADADAVAVQRPPSAVPRPGQSRGTRRIGE